ncbi:HAD hydrolase-like protein [Rhizosaccharibacter radicis]|uniref:HAD hydrolase-like protein n=1 Tax=Rhizosaccharibacter radicis TaxID=2782605 RepID=A0ABT1VWD9_9PROT|nr:HAD hydrolase-like protein [Acetobacteraceae bacterium KSS12]
MSPPPSSSPTEAVLLDLDGTLVASREGIVGGLHRALRDLGHEPDPAQDLTWVVGPPLHDILRRLLAERGDDRVALGIERYRHHYERDGMFDSPLFPDIDAAVRAIADAGRQLFLATSKPLHVAQRIVEVRGLRPLFTALYGARPDDSGAEKPELIARLIHEQRLDPGRAVMVGDRRFDITGAHANGVRAVGVLWGYGGREELEQAGADALAAAVSDLPALVTAQLAAAQHAA